MTVHAALTSEHDLRWQAVLSRDAKADGDFVFSVRSTGIYCRPSCPARRPKRENVAFHANCDAAERAGFRACLKCRPREASQAERHAAAIARICRAIEEAEETPRLDDLANLAGLSPHHFHRLFKSATGMTPAAYGRAQRAGRVREALTNGGSVTSAIHEAGYGSASRFYERSNKVLGMKPSEYRSGGVNTDIHYSIGESALGKVLVAHTGRGVCAIFLGNEPEPLIADLTRRFPKARISEAGNDFAATVAEVVSFVDQPKRGLA